MRMTVFAVYGFDPATALTSLRPRLVAFQGTALPSGAPGGITQTA